MPTRQTIVWIGLAICLGCVPNTDPPAVTAPAAPAVSNPSVVEAPPPAVPPAEVVAVTPPQTEPASQPEVNSPSPADPAAGTQPPAVAAADRVAAKAGVGKQGQSLKEHSGVIVGAAKAYFSVRQRAVFEIQIPAALKLYEATEGRKPKSHDEFMSKIIAANSITLPTLPQGDRYVYDPEQGELMVEKRAR